MQYNWQQQQQQQQATHQPPNEKMAQLHQFWQEQMRAIEQVTDFKSHSLPLARIKKIMKSDEDVRMISSEAPALFAKACEMFILELTLRSWNNAEDNKRRTLQKDDIAAALNTVEVFDFLVDVVPQANDVAQAAAAAAPGGGAAPVDNSGAGGAGMPATTMPPASVVGRGDAMGAGQQFPMPGYGGMMAQPPMQTMDPAMMAQFHSAGMAPGMPGPGAPGP